MRSVKIGTRLTVILLGALTPLLALYMAWTVGSASRGALDGMKREAQATARSVRAGLYDDARAGRWMQVDQALRYLNRGKTVVALFDSGGAPIHTGIRLPQALIPPPARLRQVDRDGFVQDEQWVAGRYWFGWLVPLRMGNAPSLGYVLIEQDWTVQRRALSRQTLIDGLLALSVLLLVIAIVAMASHRYVSRPLGDLFNRMARFSESEAPTQRVSGNEVEFLTEEFRRLDRALTAAHGDLLARHRRELELERRLRDSDKLAAVGTLASGLAHEVGTPMGIIRGRAEYLLVQRPDQGKVMEGLQIIISQIDRVSRIVRMLLDFARHGEPTRARLDLAPVVRRALHLIENEAERRAVALKVGLGDAPLLVDGDADQLQQIFINLGLNALDAMASAGGRLEVRGETRVGDDGAPRVRIVFEDTGGGVTEPDSQRIFDPFFTTKEPGKGTGMGLAVSRSIAREHGGEIALERGAAGARMVLSLPAGLADDSRLKVSARG